MEKPHTVYRKDNSIIPWEGKLQELFKLFLLLLFEDIYDTVRAIEGEDDLQTEENELGRIPWELMII